MLGPLLLDIMGDLPGAFSEEIAAADAGLATAGGAYGGILIPIGLVLCFFGRFFWMLWIFLGGAFLGGIACGALLMILGIAESDAHPGVSMSIGALIGGWVAMALLRKSRVSHSSCESSVIAGVHEQTHPVELQDQELAGLQEAQKQRGSLTVFVKEVVRRFHAASLISGALISVSGLSQTGPAGCQLRVVPDQRSGFCARAFA